MDENWPSTSRKATNGLIQAEVPSPDKPNIKTDVLILGGGLSGLALAEMLETRGYDYQLMEARDGLGGRIKTEAFDNGYFDMGPSWFWPGQPRMDALVGRLGIQRFEQHYQGKLSYEHADGFVEHSRGFSSMQGSLRLEGGMVSIVTALASRVPSERIHLNTKAGQITRRETTVLVQSHNDVSIEANTVVMALPPRLAVSSLSFLPALPGSTVQAASDLPTWMAGQAKAVAVYKKPFWRNAGMSGNAMSRRGPVVEIHDASPYHGGPYALFGFIGLPAPHRHDEPALHASILEQFGRIFGVEAKFPERFYLKDWALDDLTATSLDHQSPSSHPTYGLPAELTNVWDNRLKFSGTEAASRFGGFLEGALEAAENIMKSLS